MGAGKKGPKHMRDGASICSEQYCDPAAMTLVELREPIFTGSTVLWCPVPRTRRKDGVSASRPGFSRSPVSPISARGVAQVDDHRVNVAQDDGGRQEGPRERTECDALQLGRERQTGFEESSAVRVLPFCSHPRGSAPKRRGGMCSPIKQPGIFELPAHKQHRVTSATAIGCVDLSKPVACSTPLIYMEPTSH